jgi:hypothetical protein
MTAAKASPTPAECLHGAQLSGGWKVLKRSETTGEHGGGFSVCWIVERGSQQAFMKAIDLRRAMRRGSENPMQELERVARAYNHELELLIACAGRGMNRVVRALDHGQHLVDPGDELSTVFYLIFDIAAGARNFTVLHDVAVGISQLHGAEIAHQDLKPANLLVYSDVQEIIRLADLGRASRPVPSMPHDKFPFAGARSHAPPEGLYGEGPPTWDGRRACDLYHLAGVSATSAWVGRLDPDLLPKRIGGPYEGDYADVLPFVRQAMQDVCDLFPDLGDDRLQEVVIRCFRELCDPEPGLRGHPRARIGHRDRLSVERYVALFDLEAKRAANRQRAA